jgi:hypothetical protein
MRNSCRALVFCLLLTCREAWGQELTEPRYDSAGVSVPVYGGANPAPLDGIPSPAPAGGQPIDIPPAPGQPFVQFGGFPPTGAVIPGSNTPPSGVGLPMQPSLYDVTPKTIDPKPVEPPPKIWEGSFELGLDGTEGNSQNLNFHFGSKLKRKTAESTLTSEFAYHRNSSNSNETANAGLQEGRAEHSFSDSPWTYFIHDRLDYDEFSSYHFRVSLDAGIGYQFIKNDATSLIGRFGAGTSKDFRGPNTDFVPELVFGMEGEHKLSKKQKLTGSVEYRPDVGDFNNWRVVSKAGWEILLDEDMHLSLKFGLLDRYDSNSGTKKPNDLDYYATILWSF